MAQRGESKSQKRMSAPTIRPIPRKSPPWTFKSRPGPHSRETSVPLANIVRDMLHLAHTLKETKRILTNRIVSVNGKIRTDYRFPVGILDLVEVTAGKPAMYRTFIDHKGRLTIHPVDAKAAFLISRIRGKRTIRGKHTQYRIGNGMTLLDNKLSARVGDSVKLSVSELKVLKHLPMKENASAFVTGGTHVGEMVHIRAIHEGTQHKQALLTLESKQGTFQTIADYVYVIGEGKPEPGLGVE
ncbi:MAG: 30S ribosomal protein S4e [Candidatus Diapherotrites archaeon]|nr:30S ribosomal protein S4e [Candidatus Diapherotrites archaeon]